MASLVTILRDAGLDVQDRRVSPRPYEYRPQGVMCHHTASRAGSGDIPSLSTVLYGRPDLPGPLSQLLLGRAGTIVVCTDGYANHAGRGTAAAWSRFVTAQPPRVVTGHANDGIGGNSHFVGIEAENDGIGEPWTDGMMDAYRTLVRVLCDHYRWDPTYAVLGHKEWSGQKIDPTFDMDAFRASLQVGDDDMTPAQEAKLDRVIELLGDLVNEQQYQGGRVIRCEQELTGQPVPRQDGNGEWPPPGPTLRSLVEK